MRQVAQRGTQHEASCGNALVALPLNLTTHPHAHTFTLYLALDNVAILAPAATVTTATTNRDCQPYHCNCCSCKLYCCCCCCCCCVRFEWHINAIFMCHSFFHLRSVRAYILVRFPLSSPPTAQLDFMSDFCQHYVSI